MSFEIEASLGPEKEKDERERERGGGGGGGGGYINCCAWYSYQPPALGPPLFLYDFVYS